ncbi:MAG: hypothetical protein LQ342_000882 [Letrouitia transgressa]|nr:MAG: hypothetical protein LQ342_000882 [Letrouitia transgressa]
MASNGADLPVRPNPAIPISAPPAEASALEDPASFDIVSTYHALLSSDPLLTMPVAAIESLIHLLSSHPLSTVSETLSLLNTHTSILKKSARNPIAVGAGTDLFMRYIVSALQTGSASSSNKNNNNNRGISGAGDASKDKIAAAVAAPSGDGDGDGDGDSEGDRSGGDFHAIRHHLLTNGRLFVDRAKEARGSIAAVARRFVRDGCTVLTSGGSRVVSAVLSAASDAGVRFRVVYVQSPVPRPSHRAGPSLVRDLRRKGVPVAAIGEAAVAYAMGKVDLVIVGAEGVVENGGVINRIGTYQLGLLAKSAAKPLYVVAETHKFVRLYPLGQYDLPIEQTVLDFKVAAEEEERGSDGAMECGSVADGDLPRVDDAVDFTPPDLITALVTEVGVHTPSAVSEELIKIWY